MRQDSLEEFAKAGRTELVEQAEQEIAVLKKYLPEQLSNEELRELVKASIAETGAAAAKDMGKVNGGGYSQDKRTR